MNDKLLGQKTENHEIQLLSCCGGLKADEYWMSTKTSWIHDVARGWRTTSVQGFEGQSSKFTPYAPFYRNLASGVV